MPSQIYYIIRRVKMTALLYIVIFLCGVAATLICIGLYGCVANYIENYTSEKIKETLEEMKNKGEIK